MAITLRLSDQQERRLERLAKMGHTSKSAVIKQAIDEKFQRAVHDRNVSNALSFFQERDREILDRLAE